MFYRVCAIPSTLLIHGDGTEGSTTIADVSAHEVAVNGDAHVTDAVKRFGTGSIALDGSGDSLTLPAGSDWAFGTGDFTVSCQVLFNEQPGGNGLHLMGSHTWGVFAEWVLGLGGGSLGLLINSGVNVTAPFVPTLGQWYHIAATRKGGTVYLFVDGALLKAQSSPASIASTYPLTIGSPANGVTYLNGNLDEIHIIKGVALWTTNFIPPSVAFRF